MDITIDGIEIPNFVFRLAPVLEPLNNFNIIDYTRTYTSVTADPVYIDVQKVRVLQWSDGLTTKTVFQLALNKTNSLSIGNFVTLTGTISATFTGTFVIDDVVNVLNRDGSENTIVTLQREGADYTPLGGGLNEWTNTNGSLSNTVTDKGNTESAMRISLSFSSHPMMMLQNSEYIKDYLVLMYSQHGIETTSSLVYPRTMSLWNYPLSFSFTNTNSVPNELISYYGDSPSRAPYDLPNTRTFRLSGGDVVEIYYSIMRYHYYDGQWNKYWVQYDDVSKRPVLGRKVVH